MDYFVCSDIHGYYDIMVRDLAAAGYDELNPAHKLVVIGDLFDRGPQSAQVFDYLYRLTQEGKAIVTMGNHEPFLFDWLAGDNDTWNYNRNGMRHTLYSFCPHWKEPTTYREWETESNLARAHIKETRPHLEPWLRALPHYFETENYIFTHGSITKGDWRNADWNRCHWDRGDFIMRGHDSGKTVVIGHFSTAHLREMHHLDGRFGVGDDILKINNIIAIDGCVVKSDKMNVYVAKNERQ